MVINAPSEEQQVTHLNQVVRKVTGQRKLILSKSSFYIWVGRGLRAYRSLWKTRYQVEFKSSFSQTLVLCKSQFSLVSLVISKVFVPPIALELILLNPLKQQPFDYFPFSSYPIMTHGDSIGGITLILSIYLSICLYIVSYNVSKLFFCSIIQP